MNWDHRFLELAKHISTWSKDPSTQVGAVLVNDDRIVVGMGYNGFPRGVKDHDFRYNDRELKYRLIVHAEMNALLTAGSLARGTKMYVYPPLTFPNICPDCAKHTIQAGVKEVIGYWPVDGKFPAKSWANPKIVMDMFNEAGIRYRAIHEQN